MAGLENPAVEISRSVRRILAESDTVARISNRSHGIASEKKTVFALRFVGSFHYPTIICLREFVYWIRLYRLRFEE